MKSNILSLTLIPVIFLAASATSSDGGSTTPLGDQDPCSNRNIKVGPNQPVAIPPTPATKDCDGDGTLDCTDNEECIRTGPTNGQAHPTAKTVACTAGNQNEVCEK